MDDNETINGGQPVDAVPEGSMENETPAYGQERRPSVRERVNGWGQKKGMEGNRLKIFGYALVAFFIMMAAISLARLLAVIF